MLNLTAYLLPADFKSIGCLDCKRIQSASATFLKDEKMTVENHTKRTIIHRQKDNAKDLMFVISYKGVSLPDSQPPTSQTADLLTDSQKKSLWDSLAKDYPSEIDDGEKEIFQELEKILQTLHVPAGSSLLEAGCGSGQISALLAKRGYETSLLDFSETALEKSMQTFGKHNLQGNFILSDLFDITPEHTGTYDIVWNSGVLEHFDGWQLITALEKMSVIAKKFVIFLVPNPKSPTYLEFRKKTMQTSAWQWGLEILREDLNDLISCAGLQLVSEHYIGTSQIRYFEDYLGYNSKSKISDASKYLKMVITKPAAIKPDAAKKLRLLNKILKDDSAFLRNTYYLDTSILVKQLRQDQETAANLNRKITETKNQLNSETALLSSEITQLNILLSSEKNVIAQLQTDLTAEQKVKLQLQTDLAAQKDHIIQLQTDLNAQKDHIIQLQGNLNAQKDHISQLQISLAAEQDNAKYVKDQLNSDIVSLTRQLSFEKEHVRQLLDSKTWQLTMLYNRRLAGTPIGRLFEKIVDHLIKDGKTSSKPAAAPPVNNPNQPTPPKKPAILPVNTPPPKKSDDIKPADQPPLSQKKSAVPQDTKTSQQLQDILAQHPNVKGIIIYPPTVDWNIPLLQRPQHMALNLAKNNWLYFYCTTNTYDKVTGFKRLADRLYLTDRYPQLLETLDHYIMFVHSAHPSFEVSDIISLEGKAILVYDYLDEIHPAVSGIRSKDMLARHHHLIKNSKLVLVTARKLYDEVITLRNKDAVCLLPNAVEYSHFHVKPDIQNIPREIKQIKDKCPGPVLGYFGALAVWFDYSLVATIAESHPYWNIVLIGWDYDGSLEKSGVLNLKNVHFLGVKKYDVLPLYASWFDVCMLPFLLNDITHATSPIKLFEYMALGKPIVTTAIREVGYYQSCLVASSKKDFIDKIKKGLSLKNNVQYLSMLDREALENTWEERFFKVSEMLEKF